jgi:PAS domain-containing protein
VHHRLLLQLRDAIEADLRSVFLSEIRLADEKRVKERLEAQVTERTAELARINEALSLEVAEHKRAAAALRESEQRFRDYAETVSDWLWETGPDHRFIRVSEQLATVGVSPALRIGAARWDFATDLEEEPEKWRRHVSAKTNPWSVKNRILAKCANPLARKANSLTWPLTLPTPLFARWTTIRGMRGADSNPWYRKNRILGSARSAKNESLVRQKTNPWSAKNESLGSQNESLVRQKSNPWVRQNRPKRILGPPKIESLDRSFKSNPCEMLSVQFC